MSLFSTLLATTPATSAATSRVVRGTASGDCTSGSIITCGGVSTLSPNQAGSAAGFANSINAWLTRVNIVVTGIGAGTYYCAGLYYDGDADVYRPFYHLSGHSTADAFQYSIIEDQNNKYYMYGVASLINTATSTGNASPDLATWVGSTVTAGVDSNLTNVPALSCSIVSSVNFDITCIAGAAANSLEFLTNDPALVPVGCAMVVTGIGAGRYTYRGQGGAKALYGLEGHAVTGGGDDYSMYWSDGDGLWYILGASGSVLNSSASDTAYPYLATWTGSTVLADFAIERNGSSPANVLVAGAGTAAVNHTYIFYSAGVSSLYSFGGVDPSGGGVPCIQGSVTNGWGILDDINNDSAYNSVVPTGVDPSFSVYELGASGDAPAPTCTAIKAGAN